MTNMNRRSFLNVGLAGAVGAASFASGLAKGQERPVIQGFDDTDTDVDESQVWRPVSDRKIRVGIAGHGTCQFGAAFGFQSHPNVEVAAVTDLYEDRCADLAKQTRCEKTYASLEEMVKDDSLEAIFIATDAPSHARHAILALEHGKHVACAVPAFWGGAPDEAYKLYETVKKTGLHYGMFETSAYHDDVYACRVAYKAGAFGEIVYTEGEYFHYAPTSADSYKNWRVGMPVMWYPTHASAYYTCVTFGSFTEVSARGKKSINHYRQPENNVYGNAFGSEVGLFRTSKGGMARIMVSFDTPGWSCELGRMRGQLASWAEDGKYNGAVPEAQAIYDALKVRKPALPPTVDAGGHGGSHGYLMNNFVEAILKDQDPLVDVALALNTTMCGVVAHQSATHDGELMKIPQFEALRPRLWV